MHLPLTGIGCVSRVYSDFAVIDLLPEGATVVEMVEGLTLAELEKITGVPLRSAPALEKAEAAR